MDKIAALKEILVMDPGNSFARYGVAMELAGRGETAAALEEFDTLVPFFRTHSHKKNKTPLRN